MLEKIYTERTPFTWRLAAHPQDRRINHLMWSDFLPTVGTSSQRSQLRMQCQAFMDAWAMNVAKRGKPPSSLTVSQVYYRLGVLARWMVSQGLWSFAKLTPEHLDQYVRFLVSDKRMVVGRQVRYADSLKMHIALIRQLWTLRAHVPRPIRFDSRDVIASIKSRLVIDDGEGWLPLQESVALHLIGDAIDWVENAAPHVAVLIEFMMERRGRVVAKTKKRRTQILREIYDELAAIESYKKIEERLGADYATKAMLVRNAYRLTLGAALTLIFGLVGVRSGEATCLARDCIVDAGSHGEELFRLRSIESKRHRDRTWSTTRMTLVAVEAVRRVCPWSNDARLLQMFNGNSPMPLLGRRVRPMSPDAIAKLLQQFASSPHRQIPLSESVHPHRFRHTFARFAAKRDKRALGPLAEHFGHVFRWLTDQVYSTARDPGILSMLEDAQIDEVREGYRRLLTAHVVVGKGAERLQEMRAEVAQKSFQGKASMEAMIEAQIERGLLKLAPCSWGYCAYEQSLSACKGSNTRPNEVTRHAGLCASCSNFILTREHLPYWEERFKADEAFLAREDVNEQSRAYVEARISVSTDILRKLNANGKKVNR